MGGLADFPWAQVHLTSAEAFATLHPKTVLEKQRYLPAGYAHGFVTLVEGTEVLYKVTALYSKNGWLGSGLEPLGIKVAFTPLGVFVALVFIGLPFVVRTVQPVLEDHDAEFEEAAASLGASRLRTFTQVIFPALLPALLTGFALDRMPVSRVAAVMTGVPAIGAAVLLLPDPGFGVACIAVALIGLQQGSELDLIAYFVSRSFGFENYSSIYGAIATAGALSTATGLVLFGKVHDAFGTYDIALVIGVSAFLVGAAAFHATGLVSHPLKSGIGAGHG